MTKRRMLALACCIAAAGCGGSDKNPAASKTFNYGTPTAADANTYVGAGQTVSTITSFMANPTTADGAASASYALIGASMSTLGGLTPSSSVDLQPALGSARSRALAAVGAMGAVAPTGTFDTCTTHTETSVTFTNCQWAEGSNSMTLNGSASISGNTLSWNWTLAISVSNSGANVNATYRDHGDITVTSTTVKGSDEATLSMSGTYNGQSTSLEVAQTAAIDVTYADSCESGITGGTFEAKRVWTQRPNGADASQFPDKAVKITWTACGAATIQLGS